MTTSQLTPDAPVVLTEYDSALVRLSTKQALELRRLARGAVTVQPDDTPGTWRVMSSHYVGTIAASGARILITPKLEIGSLFYLLEASGRPVATGLADFHYGTSPDLVPSFATFYARHLERTLAHGVPAPTRKPKSDYQGYAAAWTSRRSSASPACPFPRSAALTSTPPTPRWPACSAARPSTCCGYPASPCRPGRRCRASPPSSARQAPALRRTCAPTVFTRLDEHCRPAERLARMVLGSQTLRCAAGTAGAAVFLIDMNTAFETFVAARLARYLAGHLTVRPQQTRPLGHGGTARIRPDLIFEQLTDKAVYVADTKYKITADGYARDTDYYQILAYTMALDVPAGMLIYCQRDGDALPRAITVGTHRTRLDTWALTLSGTPADIEHRLKDLANRIVERADIRLQASAPRTTF